MNTSIAPLPTVSAFTPMSSSTAPPAGQAAAVSQPRSVSPAPSSDPRPSTASGNLEKDTSIDTAGFVVVKTIDASSNEVVAQTPTEAYLRLAHAMAGTLQAESRSGSTSDKVA